MVEFPVCLHQQDLVDVDFVAREQHVLLPAGRPASMVQEGRSCKGVAEVVAEVEEF